MLELKKYRRVFFHDTEEWCKIWTKLTCGLKSYTRNLANFHQSIQKCQNWDFDGGPFVQSRKCTNLKFTKELYVMIMKNDAKRNWLVILKLTWGIWRILTWALKNLKNLVINWLLWPKHTVFELKKIERSYVWLHWRLMQNLKENWLMFSEMIWGIWQICIGWNNE